MRSPETIPISKRHIVNPTPFGEDPRKRALRVSNIVNSGQILKTLETYPTVVQLEPTVESASFLTRVIETAARILPQNKVGPVLITAAMLVSACGDSTGNETTTTPTPTSPTTITTEVPTTTTEAPTTSTSTTVPEPTTTIPETTTTTYPKIIFEAEGKMHDNGTTLELGHWKTEVDEYGNVYEIVSGRVLDVSEEEISFLEYDPSTNGFIEINRNVAVVTVVFGNYDNDVDKPLIRKFWIGRPGEKNNEIDRIVYSRPLDNDVSVDGYGEAGKPVYELYNELQKNLSIQPQIVIYLPVHFDTNYTSNCLNNPGSVSIIHACEEGATSLGFLENNIRLVEDIKNLNTPNYVPINSTDQIGYFDRIITNTT